MPDGLGNWILGGSVALEVTIFETRRMPAKTSLLQSSIFKDKRDTLHKPKKMREFASLLGKSSFRFSQ